MPLLQMLLLHFTEMISNDGIFHQNMTLVDVVLVFMMSIRRFSKSLDDKLSCFLKMT